MKLVWSALWLILVIGIAAEVQAQRFGHPGFSGRGAVQSIPPVVSPVPPISRTVIPPAVHAQSGMRPGFAPGFRHQFRNGLNTGIYPVSPIVVAPPYYDYYGYGTYSSIPQSVEPYYSTPSEPVPNGYSSGYSSSEQYINNLNDQIQQLSDEVYRLEGELSSVSTPTAPVAPAPEVRPSVPERPVVPTIMVFKNGRRMESTGYAIVGETLWVFNGSGYQTFPLSDLDTAATRSANLKNGISLRIP